MSYYTAKEVDFIHSKLKFAPFYIELVLSQIFRVALGYASR